MCQQAILPTKLDDDGNLGVRCGPVNRTRTALADVVGEHDPSIRGSSSHRKKNACRSDEQQDKHAADGESLEFVLGGLPAAPRGCCRGLAGAG